MNNLMVSSFYLEGSLLRVEVKAVDWAFGSRPRAADNDTCRTRPAEIKGNNVFQDVASTWE